MGSARLRRAARPVRPCSVEHAVALAGAGDAAGVEAAEDAVAHAREEAVAEVGEEARKPRREGHPARRARDRGAGAEDGLGAQIDALARTARLHVDEGLEPARDLRVARAQPGRWGP